MKSCSGIRSAGSARICGAPGGFLFVELIEICTESDHHEPELFSLLRRALAYLNAKDPDLRAVLHFEPS